PPYGFACACSADGNTFIFAINDYKPPGPYPPVAGDFFISTNSGLTWDTNAVFGRRFWNSVTTAANGRKIAAIASGYLLTSTNFAAPAPISPNYTPPTLLAPSADAGVLLLTVPPSTDPSNTPMYISTNWGDTWAPTAAPSNTWSGISLSADGKSIAA